MTRPRFTARIRLTLVYLGVFVAFGVLLLGLNYRLLESRLPATMNAGGVVVVGCADGQSCTPALGSGESAFAAASMLDAAIADYRGKALTDLLRVSVLSLTATAGIAAVIVWLIARRVLQPLHRISDTAKRISEHNLGERIPVAGPRDELRELSEMINGTLDRLQAAFSRERRLIANASHELRTPIANQRVLLEVTLADPNATPEELRAACRTVLAETFRTEALIEGMLTLARGQQGRLDTGPVRLDHLVRDVVKASSPGDLQVTARLTPATVQADELLCERLVTNLVTNAIRHNVPGGFADIQLTIGDETVELTVTNSAHPLDLAELAALREPFRRAGTARTRSVSGTGLGLAIVETVAQAHGWTVALRLPRPGVFQVGVIIPHVPADIA